MAEDEILAASDSMAKIPSDLSDPKDEIRSAEEDTSKMAIRAYKRRWLMLALYVFFSALVASQWVQFCVIASIITRYYGVTLTEVNLTWTMFTVSYLVTALPISRLSERVGLKWSLVLGSAFCCAGAWIKTSALGRDRFYVAVVGQAVASASVAILQTTPGRLAASWFPSSELSTATSLGTFGYQLGLSMTYLFAPLTVLNHDTVEEIGENLETMYRRAAIAATLNLALVAIVFQHEPERTAANELRALQKSKLADERTSCAARLLGNKSFLLLCGAYGLNVASLGALSALMAQLFALHFEHSERDAFKAVRFVVLSGTFGSATIGILLDNTHLYKDTAVKVYFCTLCGQVAFAAALLAELRPGILIASTFVGFSMSAYSSLSYDLAAELTHPEPEVYAAGMLNLGANLMSAGTSMALSQLMQHYGDRPICLMLCAASFLGYMLTTMISREERRQEAIWSVMRCQDKREEEQKVED